MTPEVIATVSVAIIGGIVIPWIVWVTVSIFQQKTQNALTEQILSSLHDILNQLQHPHLKAD